MPLFPVPALVALVGWLWIFVTTSRPTLLIGLGTLAAGALAFSVWDRRPLDPAAAREDAS
jgi:hypothetical protein